MDFDEVVKIRKSIRSFADKEVSIEDVKEIVEFANMAPSSRNRQPWKFVLVDKNTKNQIADYLFKYITVHKNEKTGIASSKIIKEADKLVLVLRTNFADIGYASDLLSIGAAVENACLKATEMGIDSLWVCDLVCISNYIMGLLNTGYPIVSSFCLGFRNKDIAQPKKKLLEDVFEIYNNN